MGLYDFVMSSEGINVKEFTFFKMNFVFYPITCSEQELILQRADKRDKGYSHIVHL